ncbi:type II secretion system F family protein [Nocardioides caldifontis]|uniref:type II secretion system F family protein n=1 Tax=Nocardioides caldifontis TaxID=2588938 RepID=UPI0011E00FD4|nr:type II secretion system F family protein [Nocardioides caldifontis]
MRISVIILLLLGTLTFVVVGLAALLRERARQQSFTVLTNMERRSWLIRLRRTAERRLVRTSYGRRLRWQLDNADLSIPVADAVLGSTLVALLVAVVSFNIGGPVFMLMIEALLFFGVRAWFRRREEQRRAKFIEQLPELARLLANATSAGLSLRASLGVAAQESIDPVRSELARVNDELALGASIDGALERMVDRLPSRELGVLVNVLVIQARAGGRIVTALQGITEALEVRRDLRREVNTLLAGSKATAFAVAMLAGLMVFLVHSSIDGGLRTLLANPIGLVIFFVSTGLFLFGMAMIRRATKVDV